MKKVLLFLLLIPLTSLGQTNRTTISSGDFYNPLIWSPAGIPSNGDSLIINHDVILNLDVYYTSGQILINSSGSLTEGGADRSVWIDGGSLVNHGVYTSHLIWVSSGGFITNTGSMNSIDSVLAQGAITNSGIAGINDFWIAVGGSMDNSGTLTNTDSMLVQGPFINTGFATVYDLAVDEMATFDNSHMLTVTNNMHNQGRINNTWSIDVANDFSNCNTQNLDGVITNDGVFCVGNDFLNCDTITGSGNYYIGNQSTNTGALTGTHFFHTPTGALTLNTGTIQPSVTMTTGNCTAGLKGVETEKITIYPNPTGGIVSVSIESADYELLDFSGKSVQKGHFDQHTIDMTDLMSGVYFLHVNGGTPVRILKQ